MKYIKFNTKKDVQEYIQNLINSQSYSVEFYDDFLKEFLCKYHYFLSVNLKYYPTIFRKEENSYYGFNSYELLAYFPQDNLEWKAISWRKALYPLTAKQIVKAALRRNIDQVIFAFKQTNELICSQCQCEPKLNNTIEVHHDLHFKDLFLELEQTFTDNDFEEVKELHENFWFTASVFRLPVGHPILLKFLEIHKKSKLMFLCERCHKKTHRGTSK